MSEQITLTDRQREHVRRLSPLLKEYGYEQFGNQIYATITSNSKIINITTRNKELAELILLLRKCRTQEIIVKSTLSHPDKSIGELQGQVHSIKLNNRYMLKHLERWANTFLNTEAGGFDEIKIPYKEVDDNESEYTEPFTNDELYEIIKDEKARHYSEPIEYSDNGVKGQKFWEWNNAFVEVGMFTADKLKERTGKATGKSTEFAFLFDCYDIIYGIDINYPYKKKEKYDEVRKCIASYKTTISRHNG